MEDEHATPARKHALANMTFSAPPVGYVCKVCGIPGHWFQECPSLGSRPQLNQVGQMGQMGRMGQMDQMGQTAPDYLFHTNTNPALVQSGRVQRSLPHPGYVCKVCGMAGGLPGRSHWFQDCPVTLQQQAQTQAAQLEAQAQRELVLTPIMAPEHCQGHSQGLDSLDSRRYSSVDKPCFAFQQGKCMRGRACIYSHDREVLAKYALEAGTRGVCYDFRAMGRCERGSLCRFAHV